MILVVKTGFEWLEMVLHLLTGSTVEYQYLPQLLVSLLDIISIFFIASKYVGGGVSSTSKDIIDV